MFKKTMVRLIPHLPRRLVETIAARYIAGKTDDEALVTANRLVSLGYAVTLDILGEDTTTLAQAASAADDYVHLLSRLVGTEIPSNVSVKLTQLGLRIDEQAARDNLVRILKEAAKGEAFVRIDMEDASLTEATLRVHRMVKEGGFNTGTVLQARLKRTRRDAASLQNASIRLCKGAYKESPTIAYERQVDIRNSYMETFHTLIENGCKVAAATHDLKLISRILKTVERESIPKDRVEFQALLGVPMRKPLESLRQDGFTVRLYVPFGAASFAYSLRRLNENPDLAFAVFKGLFKPGRLDA
jgi:proline dehydrogenase